MTSLCPGWARSWHKRRERRSGRPCLCCVVQATQRGYQDLGREGWGSVTVCLAHGSGCVEQAGGFPEAGAGAEISAHSLPHKEGWGAYRFQSPRPECLASLWVLPGLSWSSSLCQVRTSGRSSPGARAARAARAARRGHSERASGRKVTA